MCLHNKRDNTATVSRDSVLEKGIAIDRHKVSTHAGAYVKNKFVEIFMFKYLTKTFRSVWRHQAHGCGMLQKKLIT